jgi:hypothetical protein
MLTNVLFPDELQLHVDRIEMDRDTVKNLCYNNAVNNGKYILVGGMSNAFDSRRHQAVFCERAF